MKRYAIDKFSQLIHSKKGKLSRSRMTEHLVYAGLFPFFDYVRVGMLLRNRILDSG